MNEELKFLLKFIKNRRGSFGGGGGGGGVQGRRERRIEVFVKIQKKDFQGGGRVRGGRGCRVRVNLKK